MKMNFLKKTVSALLAVILLASCVPVVFASSDSKSPAESPKWGDFSFSFSEDEPHILGFESNAVIVGVTEDAPPVEELLQDFDIKSVTPVTTDDPSEIVFIVRFVMYFNGKCIEDRLDEAIPLLIDSPYVNAVDFNYYFPCDSTYEPTPADPTETTEPDTPPSEPVSEPTSPTEDITEDVPEPVLDDSEDAGAYVTQVAGDADGDGDLTVKDVTCIKKYSAKLISSKQINCSAANVSGTGTVTARDATMIQKKLAGILCDW